MLVFVCRLLCCSCFSEFVASSSFSGRGGSYLPVIILAIVGVARGAAPLLLSASHLLSLSQVGYDYEFFYFGSMVAGLDMEGSDRDINVQPRQDVCVNLLDWMKAVADKLKALAGVTVVRECPFKHTIEAKILGNWVDIMFSCRREQTQIVQSHRLKEPPALWQEAGRLASGRTGRQEGHGRQASEQTDRQTGGQADGRTARQTDKQIYIHRHSTYMCGLVVVFGMHG